MVSLVMSVSGSAWDEGGVAVWRDVRRGEELLGYRCRVGLLLGVDGRGCGRWCLLSPVVLDMLESW